jgi:hypothetical protein
METEEKEFGANLVRSGIDFLAALGEHYGNDRAMELWDGIRSTVGEDLAGAIFMAMLTGEVTRTVLVKLVQPDINMKIDAIKQVRSVTGMGLKEAKDFVEAVCFTGPQRLTLMDGVKINEFVREMNRAGFGVN